MAEIEALPGATFEATLSNAPSGLVGTVGVRILDNVGGTTLPRTTLGITENPAGSGFYYVTLVAPTVVGQYTVFWDNGVVSPTTTSEDSLLVAYSLNAGPSVDIVARDSVRRLIGDGRPSNGPPFGIVRLEDLSDQIQAQATPTQTGFLLRFTQVPTFGSVTCYAIPASITAYLDGSTNPVAPTVDADSSVRFVLPTPPVARLQVTYGWQYHNDIDVDSWVDDARAWLGYGSVAAVPDRLRPALNFFAASQACSAMATRCALGAVTAGQASSDLEAIGKRYSEQSKALMAQARAVRKDAVDPPEETNPAAMITTGSAPGRYDPWR